MDKQQMTFNGVEMATAFRDKGFRFSVESIEGRGPMENIVSSRPVPGADGELFLNKSLPARHITVAYNLIAADAAGLRKAERELNRILQVDQPKQLRFQDQAGYFEAIHAGISVTYEMRGNQKGTIDFFCPKPFFWHSYIEYKEFVYTPNETRNFDILTNYKVLPVMVFTIPGAISSLTITTNGSALKYTGAIPAGAKVSIDSEKKELRINNVLKVIEVDGWFPIMVAGVNTVKSSNSATLTLKYQERYV